LDAEPRIGATGEDWTSYEVDVVVAAYADMLRAEQRGEGYSKADRVRELQRMLPTRSKGSIERKLQNVSAVLDEDGLPWIAGYKPLPHYQRDLRPAITRVISPSRRIGEALAAYGESALVAPATSALATDDVLVPPPTGRAVGRRGSKSA
jgi:hypothetical protein